MAATRCANPKYQQEVYEMMNDYVRYKAIEAQLQVLEQTAVVVSESDEVAESVQEANQEALRLVQTYDLLRSVSQQQDQLRSSTDESRVDGAILQFLTLLNIWSQEHLGYPSICPLSAATRQALWRDRLINRFFRQRWLCTRAETRMTDHVCQYTESEQSQITKEVSLADHLLPRFLHLSFLLQPDDAEPSEKWMRIAADIMLHAVAEHLDHSSSSSNNPTDTETYQTLEECFAWGYVVRSRFCSDSPLGERIVNELREKDPDLLKDSFEATTLRIGEVLELEDDVWEMFFNPGNDATPQSSGEWSSWTGIRSKTMNIVLDSLSEADEGAKGPHDAVMLLRKRFPWWKLFTDIGVFLTDAWSKYHAEQWHGKPTLIQIENGYLHGLNDEEFESFKTRVGIKSDEWVVI